MVGRRVFGERLEHILGWAAFCGLRVAVGPGVFVPRVRSELLVARARALAPPQAVVVDLCCGSGAIALALQATVAKVYAVDIDPVAVRCARCNLGSDQVFQGDLYAPLPSSLRGRVDILTANAPYVPTQAIACMPGEAREHEPAIALDGGPDGLEVVRRGLAACGRSSTG